MQHVGSRGDGVGAEEQFQSGFLGGGDEAVGRGLVAGDVHVASGHLHLALDAAGGVCDGGVCIVSVVPSGVDDLDVGFGHFGLLAELLADEVFGYLEVAVEEPAHQTDGKHVAAFQDGLVVHARRGQAVFHHRGDGGSDDFLLDAHLFDGVLCLEGGLLQVGLLEGVGVNDNGAVGLDELILCLQCGCVHSHQYVTLVARCIYFLCTDMHLETGDARQ